MISRTDIAAGLLLCAVSASAAQAADALAPAYVDGSGELLPEHSVVAIDASEWEGRNLSLAEILAEIPGITVRSYGGVGAEAEVVVRGVGGGRIPVFLDGVRLDAGGTGADLGKIDPAVVGRIEVHSGRLPAELGADGVGGAIVLRTRTAERGPAELNLSWGSFGTQRHSFLWRSATPGKGNSSVGFSFLRSDNDYEVLDRNRTPYNKSDDTLRRQSNAEYTAFSAMAAGVRRAGNGALRHSFVLRADGGGLPGAEGARTVKAAFANQNAQGSLSWSVTLPVPKGEADLELGLDGAMDANRMSWGDEDHLSPIAQGDVEISNEDFRTAGSAALRWSPSPAWDLRLSQRGGFERLVPRDIAGQANWNREASRIASQTSGEVARNLGRRARVSVSGTGLFWTEEAEDPTAGSSKEFSDGDWTASASWSWRPAPRWELRSWCGRGLRVPSLQERFGAKRGALPNFALEPERSLKWEIGAARRGKRWSAEANWFENSLENTVVRVASGELAKALNAGRAHVRGADLSFSAAPARFLRLSAAGAWTRAIDRGPSRAYRGKFLPNSPEWEGKFGSALFRGPWEIGFDASWTSEFYRDRANRNEAKSALQLSSGIKIDLSRNVRIRFRAEDLLDRAPESAYSSYPRPGRRFLVGLGATFPTQQTTNNQRTEHAS